MRDTATQQAPLPLLKAGPALVLRKESVSVPELGGSVIVVGLRASEAFAITALKEAATVRLAHVMRRAREDGTPPDPSDLELGFGEWQQYGRYVPELLAHAVQGEGDLALYTAAEWELMGQHHPGVIERLQAVAERLSGLDRREREKNSSSQG